MSSDTIADLLTMIRNAQIAKHPSVSVPASKVNLSILEVLKEEGFIGEYQRKDDEHGFPRCDVELKYFKDGEPIMESIKRVSKPGCRVYRRVDELHKVKSGLGVAILSTSQGVMSDQQAKRNNIGGEVLALIG